MSQYALETISVPIVSGKHRTWCLPFWLLWVTSSEMISSLHSRKSHYIGTKERLTNMAVITAMNSCTLMIPVASTELQHESTCP